MDFETVLMFAKSFSLVWFFAIFAGVLFLTFRKKNREKIESYRLMVLDKE